MVKTALVLSGGGAKGAFQVGAETYCREKAGYRWDVIAGVSVGVLNGVMLASQQYQRLGELWRNLKRQDIYRGGLNLVTAIRLLFIVQDSTQTLTMNLKDELKILLELLGSTYRKVYP